MVELKIPRENANDDFVLVTAVKVKNGDFVARGDVILEFETSKASVEFHSPSQGYVYELTAVEQKELRVDDVFCVLAEKEKSLEKRSKSPERLEVTHLEKKLSKRAKELLAQGKDPLVDAMWVSSAAFKGAEPKENLPLNSLTTANLAISLPTDIPFIKIATTKRKRQEVNALRQCSPYLNSTLGVELNVCERAVENPFFSKSIIDLVIYETFLLLSGEYLDLNTFYISEDINGQFQRVIPGIAMDDNRNLTVVRVPPVNSLHQLTAELVNSIARFQEQKLKMEDLLPATYTVSDLSSFDVDFMLPLVNGHQCFILGLCATMDGFRIYGTFDHRVTEGRRFAQFLSELKRRLLLYFVDQKSTIVSGSSCFYCGKSMQEERALGHRGMLKVYDGISDRLICRNCYEGW